MERSAMEERLRRHRNLALLVMAHILVVGCIVLYLRRPQSEAIDIVEPTALPSPSVAQILVHIAGAVRQPGVYTLPVGSRLLHALAAAGGFAEDADQESTNQADILHDGQRVLIPRLGTPIPSTPTPLAPSPTEGSSVGPVDGQPVAPLGINTASAEALSSLPGIGPVLAQRIVAHRQARGPFTTIEQLTDVKGIGEATLTRIRPYITLR